MVAVAVAIVLRDVGASAFVDLPRAVAHATGVQASDAVVHGVAHPVAVHVFLAIAAAHARRVEDVAVAIAVALGNAISTAHPTLVQGQAAAVVVRGCGFVVASRRQRASGDFIFVADAVSVFVVQAIALTIESFFRKGAVSVDRAQGVVVARFRRRAIGARQEVVGHTHVVVRRHGGAVAVGPSLEGVGDGQIVQRRV